MKDTTIVKKVIKAFDDAFKEVGMPDMETSDILVAYYEDELTEILLELYKAEDYPENIMEQTRLISKFLDDEYDL